MSVTRTFSGPGPHEATQAFRTPAPARPLPLPVHWHRLTALLMAVLVISGMAGQSLLTPPQAQAAPIAGFNSATDPDVIPMIGSFNWLPASYLTGPVDAKTVEINNGATSAQRTDAVNYEQYPYPGTGRNFLSNTAYMGGLRTAYIAANNAGQVPLVNALLAQQNYTSSSSAYLEPEWPSSDNAKQSFQYKRPYCRLGSAIQRTGSASYGDCATVSYGYPSGHSRIGWTEGIGLAIMLPEVAPQIMARTAEIVNGRVVLGVHSPLDVMAGRAIATRMIAHRMTDPTWKAKFDAARTQLRSALEAQCGKAIAQCLVSSPVTMSNTDAINVERGYLTYGLPNVGAPGVALSAPDYAYNLLEYAFPAKTTAERNAILAATAIDSGAPLDTTGSTIDAKSIGWTRLDLGSALTYAATPGTDALALTKSVKDKATGSTTTTKPGAILDYVVSAKGAGQVSLNDAVPAPQVLNGSSLTVPQGWTKSVTGNSWTASGDASNYGTYTGTPTDVNLGTVSTTRTGGDGYVPVPYKDKVFGAYHYTADGGFGGGSPVIWAADKKTGAMTSYDFGLGQGFVTPWIADPIRVGGKLFVPGFLAPDNPVKMQAYSTVPIGFACFDMDALAPCSTNWYPIGKSDNVTFQLSKGTSAIAANSLMRMGSLGMAKDGIFRITSQWANQAVLYSVKFDTGAPVLQATAGLNVPNFYMQAQNASGTRIYTVRPGGTKLQCTDTSTGGACAGWTDPTAVSSSSSSFRVIPVDVLNAVCVSDSLASPAYAKKCFDMGTGAASTVNFSLSQNIAGPQFRFNASGTKQYYGPGYGASGSIFCIDGTTGAACAGFGTNGYAPVVGGVSKAKTYGVSADDLYPACMWTIGDAGQLYPFNAETGAPGCGGAMATVTVTPPNLWCDGASGHVRGFTTLALNGTVPTGNVTISVTRDGAPVAGWTGKIVPAAASIDISALPYQAGSTYAFSVSINGSASSMSSISVNMDQDDPQVCFSTTVPNDCTVTASPLTNQVTGSMVAGSPAVTTTASSNTTSINAVAAAGACASGVTIVKKINGNDANTSPGVSVPGGSTMAITYDVTNSGQTPLTAVTVTDDKVAAASISCPKTALAVGETMQCTASLTAPAPGVQHTNVGTVTAKDPSNADVSDTDPANAIVAAGPAISIVKKINGDDANAAPGVQVVAGSSMAITYDVKNEGNVSLTAVKVTDDKVAAAAISCPKTTLAVGETMQCTASLTAPAAGGSHVNTGTVEGTSPQSVKVTDTDPANAFAPAAALPAKISGHVYADPNNNSVHDAGEGVISGVTITLLQGSTVVATTTTDVNGYYQFTNLAAGTYTVRETQPAGWLDGGEKAGSKGGTVTDDQIAGIVLVAGDDAVDYDFFEIPQAPGISIVKKINGDDANTAPGVSVIAGSTMAITYDVKNEGNVPLTAVKVTDDKVAAAAITCPKTVLAAGESMQCAASLAAPVAGLQHTNTGAVVGTPPSGANVTDTDPANAIVAALPGISIVKKINGDDANAAPGVIVGAGSTMAITYDVKNTGNVALSGVKVTDDKVAAASISCPKASLAVGESMQCTASLAAPGPGVQHTNTGTVEGTSPQGTKVTDTDPANATVTPTPGIKLVKKINGDDANTAPGTSVPAGSTMAVTFEVTNTGNVALTDVKVTDDKIAAAAISCPKTALAVGETMVCTASLAAPAAGVQHTNTGSVEGTSPQGAKVTDADPANANVTPAPSIAVVKKINGMDANGAPGVKVPAGSTMAITYEVTNTGNVALSGVKMADDKVAAAAITCPKTTLAPGESMDCSASIPAPAPGEQHTNLGTVEGTSPQGVKVTDDDPANAWTEGRPAIAIVKTINGADANDAPGVTVPEGSVMQIRFLVTNTGDVDLSDVKVTDSVIDASGIVCPRTTLAVGASMSCMAVLDAPAPGVQHTNVGVVTAKDAAGTVVTDDDPANANVPAAPSVKIIKKINGDDANAAPGVTVADGSTMAVTFEVTNTGNVVLDDVTVTDDTIDASAIECGASSLAPGESMTCTADLAAPAPGVQHTNTGAVEGTSPQGVKVTDDDPANANVTPVPGIKVIKRINGDDANAAPGVKVDEDSTMAVTFEVINTGNVKLTDVQVSDDVIKAGDIDCPKTELARGETMVCTASLKAAKPGVQHTNLADVVGTSPQGVKVTDDDGANAHVTPLPAVSIIKMINGDDANDAPGIEVEQDSPMNITFAVKNTGNVALTGVKVTDDKVDAASIDCPKAELAVGEEMTCSATLAAPAPGEMHENLGTVEATSPQGDKVTAEDPAKAHVVAKPSIEVVKTINGSDANETPGVEVEEKSTMEVGFKVTNTGNVKLTDVTITDDQIASDAIECPKSELAPGESMDCTAALAAPAAGQTHTNLATASGTSPQGITVEDEDPANAHVVAKPSIKIVKSINGSDANEAPGVEVAAGSTMAVTYLVTNTGNVPLVGVTVTDDKIDDAAISCPAVELAPGESITCIAELTAPDPGVQHTNTGTVKAADTEGTEVTDADPANAHVKAAPKLVLIKKINGDDANEKPGVVVAEGSTMEITFEITNAGNTWLTGVKLTDDVVDAKAINCPKDALAPGETITCTAKLASPAPGVQHTNIGTVTAQPADSKGEALVGTEPLSDDDPANAIVEAKPAVTIVKTINGSDANAAPGVIVEQGSKLAVEFEVTNNGNVKLTDVKVTDDKIAADAIDCPKTELAPGEKMVCKAELDAPAPGVQHTNLGKVTAKDPAGEPVTDDDPANALVKAVPGITIVKKINGDDANAAPGVKTKQGDQMTVTFEVKNTGNVKLTNVQVSDDKIKASAIDCPKAELEAGEQMVCTAKLLAPAAGTTHTNVGTATGTTPDGTKVSDNDPANASTEPKGTQTGDALLGNDLAMALGGLALVLMGGAAALFIVRRRREEDGQA